VIDAPSKPTVGFIGLGSQGGPMAQRIGQAGFPLMLWARRADSLAPFADTGAQIAEGVAALGGACDIVCLCVLDDAGVIEIAEMLLPAMRPGSRLVIHSTINPNNCIALAERFAARGIAVIDAPVSGGGAGAAAGTLTVMAGGPAEDIAAIRPVLESFAGLISHLGRVGAGQYAKLVNNTLMAANMALADAALGAGAALGLDQPALIELVKASSGRSYGFEVRARLPDLALFNHGGKLLAKDVRLLGAVLGEDRSYKILEDVAKPLLNKILT
jgi:3-hydroxyisobutyrate dehydrogenase-like beta-hydroxyacid dehydrogenase